MTKAGFGGRFVAYIIDMVLISIIGGILAMIAAPIIGFSASSDSGMMNLFAGAMSWLLLLVMFLLQFLYFGYLWSSSGQSLGMKVMKVKVVHADGNLPSFLMAALRGSVGYWISTVIFYLGFIWAAFDANGEAWHDKLFKTRVVQA